MGTLDDAIREHLELKRRSGAGEDEVSRLENEAFGAARREPPAPAVTPEADVPAPEATEPLPPPVEPPVSVSVPVEPVAPAPPPTSDSWLDDEPEIPTVPREPEPEPEHHAGGSTAISDYVAPDEEGEDLLEETPDFLQETPEHDRLWFEQKPPRDFDFD